MYQQYIIPLTTMLKYTKYITKSEIPNIQLAKISKV
jgi:hypothetical protein